MSGTPSVDSELIVQLSRELLEEVAPEELDLFDELATEYHANPVPPDRSARTRDDALGFGLDAELIAISPAVIAAMTACLNFIVGIISESLKNQGETFINAQLKKLFEGKKPTDSSLSLDTEQLRHVRKLTLHEARRFGMGKAEADKLADALIGRLAMGK